MTYTVKSKSGKKDASNRLVETDKADIDASKHLLNFEITEYINQISYQ